MKREMRCKWRDLSIHSKITTLGDCRKSQALRDVFIFEYGIGTHTGIPLTFSQIILPIGVPYDPLHSF